MYLQLFTWVILVTILVISAIIGGFIVLFVTTALLEKIHLDDFIPAPDGEPLADSRYFTAMNDSAKHLGFIPAGVFVQNRSSRIHRAQVALWVSPERDILLQIGGGKTAGVPIKRTILYSILSTNQIIQTQDDAGTVDLSGLTDQRLILRADLDELLSCHSDRLASRIEQKQIFSTETAFSDWQSIKRMKAEQMARMGFVQFLNQEHTIYRHTPKGAWLQYYKGLRGQMAQVESQMDRASKKRPGSV